MDWLFEGRVLHPGGNPFGGVRLRLCLWSGAKRDFVAVSRCLGCGCPRSFCFFSAAEEEVALVDAEEAEEGDILAEEEREKPARRVRPKAAASGSAGLAKRVEAIEHAVDKIATAVGKISRSSPPTSTPTSSVKSSPKVMSPKPKTAGKRPSALRNKYPLLDGGVV